MTQAQFKTNDVFTVGRMPNGDISYCNKIWIAGRTNGQYIIARLVVDMDIFKSTWCTGGKLVPIHTEEVKIVDATPLLNNQQMRKAILMRRYNS